MFGLRVGAARMSRERFAVIWVKCAKRKLGKVLGKQPVAELYTFEVLSSRTRLIDVRNSSADSG